MSPIVPNYNEQCLHYNNVGWQGNNYDGRQVCGQRRFSYFSQNSYNDSDNTKNLTILYSYSTRQALAQTSLNFVQEYNGNNKNMTIQWLYHIKMVVEKTGIDPLEVGIKKLNGLALGNINAICKEGNLTWYSFRQRLIELYSNVSYESNAMFVYSHLSQGDKEPTAQYLARAKALLE